MPVVTWLFLGLVIAGTPVASGQTVEQEIDAIFNALPSHTLGARVESEDGGVVYYSRNPDLALKAASVTKTFVVSTALARLGPDHSFVTQVYQDGPVDTGQKLSSNFSSVTVSYDCSCGAGLYCDSGEEICKSEDAISLGITSLTSYLDNYNEGRSKSFYCTSCQLLPLDKLKEALAIVEARISKDAEIKEKARIVRAEISHLADSLNTDLKLRK